ncbi:MAG: sensor histidine kinase [bacterium]
MMSPVVEHVHMALEIGSFLLLICTLVVMRRRRLHTEGTSRNHVRAHELQLQQKDLLIREVHHRVANQMGLTAALLHLQASRSVNPDAKAHLFDSENRIRTLSTLHERLHQTDSQGRILLYPYLSDLARDLISSLRPDLVFCPKLAGDSPSTKSNIAITCGLLVNELVTNCIKHAFPQNRPGMIRLSLDRPPPDRLRISIQDDGTGLPGGLTLQDPLTSGMAIISALTKDLSGTFTAVKHQPGTEFIIDFPLAEIDQAS